MRSIASSSNASCLRRVDLAGPLGVLDGRREEAEPFRDELGDPVADRTGPRIQLGRDRREEAPTRKDAALEVGQELVRKRPQTHTAGRRRHPGLDDLGVEEPGSGVDRRQLELLLGLEVRVEAALAHTDPVGQAADREAVDPLDRGQPGRCVEDRVPRALAVRAGLSCGLCVHTCKIARPVV